MLVVPLLLGQLMCVFLYVCTGQSFSVIVFAYQQHNFMFLIPLIIHSNYVQFYLIIVLLLLFRS